NYSHEAIVARTNADLANDLGNLAQRSLSMIAKNCDGKVPAPGKLAPADAAILAAADGIVAKAREAMKTQQLHLALAAVWAAVAARARAAGIGRMLTISTLVEKFAGLRAIAERFDDVYCSIGTHPHHAAKEPDVTAGDLVAAANHPKVVAIGEAGLDYHYDNS